MSFGTPDDIAPRLQLGAAVPSFFLGNAALLFSSGPSGFQSAHRLILRPL